MLLFAAAIAWYEKMPIYYFVVSFIKSTENREQSNHSLYTKLFCSLSLQSVSHSQFVFVSIGVLFLFLYLCALLAIFFRWFVFFFDCESFKSHHLNGVLHLRALVCCVARIDRWFICYGKVNSFFFCSPTILLQKLCKRAKIVRVRERELGWTRVWLPIKMEI